MKKILIIGGDSRLKCVFSSLTLKGYSVSTMGLFGNDSGTIEDADIIILPVPATKDRENIYCPLTDRKIPIAMLQRSKADALILAGCFSYGERESIDYCSLDSYALLNAVPTAEGAIAAAIENTPHTLWKSRALVIGFGRVGKILSERLAALKCELTVSARKQNDFAMLEAMGISHIETSEVKAAAQDFDIIFNTIDVDLFNGVNIKSEFPLVIDLSTKGCITEKEAQEAGMRYLKLPAIPAKTAVLTAGEILSDTILKIIR